MISLSTLSQQFRQTSFRQQLMLFAVAGAMGISLLAASLTSWQSSRQLHAAKLDDGLRIVRGLAAQSRLALAFGSTENVAEAVSAVSAFTDIRRIEILYADGRTLLEHGAAANLCPRPELREAREPYLETEDSEGWCFVAPVWSTADPQSQFETTERNDILLGYALIRQSKNTLKKLVTEVFVVNFSAGIALAAFMVFVLRRLARRMTRPLAELSGNMARAERGETGLRTQPAGPRDIAEMAQAFNSMMAALEERELELRTTRDSALRFARLKADFAATVSHEIRTPLNGVIGTLDMLKKGRLEPAQRELLGLAWNSSQYLLELINNILDFSRLEAGRFEMDNCDFNLQEVVDTALALFRNQADRKRLNLCSHLDATLPTRLNGDPGRIRQVLVNLLGNAVKFTEAGSIVLKVEKGSDSGFIRFSVQDSGIGIPRDALPTIFDSFTQADTSTTRRYGGSGLGLAICKQIVSLLGGEIGVASTLGEGSQFWFTMRCTPASGAAPQSVPASAVSCSGRILIAEDNATNQVIAAGMLRLLGCTSRIAGNGREALELWQQGGWDMILMDCAMPEMDGFQATAAIREQEAGTGRHTPIIAMTANVMPSDIEHCKASGMDEHLAKPLTLEALSAQLQRWLHWQAALPEAETPPEKEAPQVIDPLIIGRLRETLGDMLGAAVRPFIEDMPGYLIELDSALAAADADALKRIAHGIKGAASNLGAVAVADAARLLENQADTGDFAEAAEQLKQLRAEFAIAEPLLAEDLTSTPLQHQYLPGNDAPLVLIVDDDRSTRGALRHALQRGGFRVDEAGDGREALLWLESNLPDAILMDALMPVMDGFAACTELKKHASWQDIPVLMITALEDRQSIERAFAAGASDFIPKPIHLSVVNQRLRRIVEATRAERNVRQLAYNDTLTGLPNRLLFVEQMNRAIERNSSRNGMFALLFLDLDRFKNINDTMGHEAGDQLLAAMAQRLKNCVRADDVVSRLGGDEFTLLLDDLPNTSVAAMVAQNICRTISAPLSLCGQEIVMTASIGISIYPGDGDDVSNLLRHADTAMYRAKQCGSAFCYYEAAMESALSQRLRLETDLRRALERNEITVFYQPVVSAENGRNLGVEALVRWQHPEKGIVPPDEFIPVSEETGLILALGERVLRTACFQAKSWMDNGLEHISVAVNLSARQLEQADLREVVIAALRDSGLPPAALTLEITESVLMERAEACIGLLRDLRAHGIHVSIDDFGTGYSSLAYLKHLPANTLKIDKSFIQDIEHDDDALAIVTGIIALAHSLRMKVVAEGVETAAQRDRLIALGCDALQGYLFSKPLPAEFVETQLSYAALLRQD